MSASPRYVAALLEMEDGRMVDAKYLKELGREVLRLRKVNAYLRRRLRGMTERQGQAS